MRSVTLEGWVYLDTYGKNSLGRVISRPSGQQIFVAASCQCFFFQAQRWSTAQGSWKTPQGSIQTARWYYLAATYDYSSTANDPTLYIDGQPVAISEAEIPAGAAGLDDDPWYIGNTSASGPRTFDGRIDEVAVYDYLLSPAAVAQHFSAGQLAVPSSAGSPIVHRSLTRGWSVRQAAASFDPFQDFRRRLPAFRLAPFRTLPLAERGDDLSRVRLPGRKRL